MGIVNLTGFETGNFDEVNSVVGNVTVSSAVVRTGNYSLCVDPAGQTSYVTIGSLYGDGLKAPFGENFSSSAGYYRFYFRCGRAPGGLVEIFTVGDVRLLLTDGMELHLYLGVDPILLSASYLTTGQWYRIGVRRTSEYDSANNLFRQTVVLQVNGAQVFSSSWLVSFPPLVSHCVFGSLADNAGNTGLYYYDDVALADDEIPPAGGVTLLRPVGNLSANYVSASAGQLWQCVDDIPRNNFSDFVALNDPPPGSLGQLNVSYYPATSSLPVGSGVVNAVKGLVTCRFNSLYNTNGYVARLGLAYNGRSVATGTAPISGNTNSSPLGATFVVGGVYTEDYGTSVSDVSFGVVGNGNSEVDSIYMMVDSGGSDYTSRPQGRLRLSGTAHRMSVGGVFIPSGAGRIAGLASVRRVFDGGSADGGFLIGGEVVCRIGYRHLPVGLLGVMGGTVDDMAADLAFVIDGQLALGGIANTPLLLDTSGVLGWGGMASVPHLASGTGRVMFGGMADQPILADGGGLLTLLGLTEWLGQGAFYHSPEGAFFGPSAEPEGFVPSLTPTSEGGLVFGGRAGVGAVFNFPIAYVSDYSVEMLYLGELTVSVYGHEGSGRLTVLDPAAEVEFVPYGQGGRLVLGGLAPVLIGLFYQPTGHLSLRGSTPFTQDFFSFPLGGLALSGVVTPTTTVAISADITWRIRQTQYAGREITWSTGPRAFSFFRVVGKCKPLSCPPVQTDCSSNVSFTVNIYARNVSEVCQKLRQRNFQFPIQRIEQFSATDPQCRQLVDVTPSFTVLECADLLVDFNASSGFVMDTVVVPVLAFEGGGSLRTQGVALSTTEREFEFAGTGGLAIGGVAPAEQRTRAYEASGQIGVYSRAPVYSGQHAHVATGGVGFSGRWPFISSAYTVQMLGSLLVTAGRSATGTGVLGFGGVADVAFGQSTQLGGTVRFGGEATVRVTVANGSGKIGIGGSADIVASDLGVVVTGPIGVDSLTVLTSHYFAFSPAGPLPNITRTIGTTCCPGGLPLVITLQQPLSGTNYFGEFLSRNGINWSGNVPLTYLTRDKAWTATESWVGHSPYVPTRERWTVSYSWTCVPDSVGRLSWQFGVLVTLLPDSGRRLATRLTVVFDSTAVCRTNKSFRFSFQVNTRTKSATPATLRPVVLVDEIGLFRSSRTSPSISFKLSESLDDTITRTVNITPAITAAEQVVAL